MKFRAAYFKKPIICCISLMVMNNHCGAAFAQADEKKAAVNDEKPKLAEKKIALAQARLQTTGLPQTSQINENDQNNAAQDAASQEQGVFVGSIAIIGSENLKAENFSSIVESNIGQELQEEELRNITQQIADQARGEGYLFASASIPEQAVTLGILQIKLDEGRIDEVRIVGSDNKALRNLLQSLNGTIAKESEIERKLVLANDIPKIRVRKTRFLNEAGLNILEVNVKERKNRFSVSADNYGSDRFGPVRAKLAFDYEGLFSDSDKGSLSIRTNPTDPEELVFVSANHSIGVGNDGTRIGINASAGRTQPGSITGFGNIDGDSNYVSIYASHPLIRSNESSLWINASAAYLDVTQEIAGAMFRVDTQVTFSLGVSANNKLWGGRLRTGTTITQGVGVLGTTRFGNPASSRFDGDGVFTKSSSYLNWRGKLTGNLGLYFSVYGQVANRALLASQELNIGGAFSARGFNFSEISGENGFVGLGELNYTLRKPFKWLDRLQPYIFMDGGYVDNIDDGFGGGTLLSGGLGLRGDVGPLNFELEGAFPINRDRFKTDDKTPQVNVSVGLDL